MAIRRLSETVANHIAAGEVVERPASVVKELVENAVDAGADTIQVEIEGGGVRSIRVLDNGAGIPFDEMPLAFERHATSKVAALEDLSDIHTLGFRGEALPSIAAVSDTTLHSRAQDAQAGGVLRLNGGETVQHEASACAQGSVFEIRNLFFNTPVRRSFLKSESAESGAVGDVMLRMMLSHPDIAITYIKAGKKLLSTPGDGKLQSAIYAVYGADTLPHLRDVSYEDADIKITGYVGAESYTWANRTRQTLIINGRYVRHSGISYAIQAAFGSRLPHSRFPFYVLHLTLPNHEVDVNVHPTKMEVRFKRDAFIRQIFHMAVSRALQHPSSLVEDTLEAPQTKPDVDADDELRHEVSQVFQNRGKLNQHVEVKNREDLLPNIMENPISRISPPVNRIAAIPHPKHQLMPPSIRHEQQRWTPVQDQDLFMLGTLICSIL